VVQQAAIALNALEGIVGRGVALLVETKVVLVGLFVLELLNVSPDDDADVELEEETENANDGECNLSTRVEQRATRNLFEVLVVTLNQRALGEHEVERERSQADGEEEAEPDENRISLDHATVSNY